MTFSFVEEEEQQTAGVDNRPRRQRQAWGGHGHNSGGSKRRKSKNRHVGKNIADGEASWITAFVENVSGYRVVAKIAKSLSANVHSETYGAYKGAYLFMAVVFGYLGYVFDILPTINAGNEVAQALIKIGIIGGQSAAFMQVAVVSISLIPTLAEFFGGAMALEGSWFANHLVQFSVAFDLWTDYKVARIAAIAFSAHLFGSVAALSGFMPIINGVSTVIMLVAGSWGFEVLTISFLLAAWEIHKKQRKEKEW